ncbi:MAG TPA: hypothetical protein VL418_12920 [Devosiaceae bacterium]|jgi:hypothetical protein|nr:hypothetical protein [Devosiaceae bacterium]
MNFFDKDFARYARSTFKRRRGWSLAAAAAIAWLIIILLCYGVYELIAHV